MVEYNKDGSLRCNLCEREPCRCGVPVHFVKAYDDLTAALRDAKPVLLRAAATIKRLGDDVEDDDLYFNCTDEQLREHESAYYVDAAALRVLAEMGVSDG